MGTDRKIRPRLALGGLVCGFFLVGWATRCSFAQKSAQEPPPAKTDSIARATAAFGKDHWSAAKDLAFRYYNADLGYWIYAQEVEQIREENGVRYDGKRVRLKPFLVISTSRDGKSTRTITGDVAIIDLNQPLRFNVSPDGETLKVAHVHLEKDVQIRDNMGTPNDESDDMKITSCALDYDEAAQQITTEWHVVIEDSEMVTSGTGMLLQLRDTSANAGEPKAQAPKAKPAARSSEPQPLPDPGPADAPAAPSLNAVQDPAQPVGAPKSDPDLTDRASCRASSPEPKRSASYSL